MAILNRGSYLSAHVLLNLLNVLAKSNKMQGWSCILSLFCNEFNKFNYTGAQMLDSTYHMTMKNLEFAFFVTTLGFSRILRHVEMDVITFPENL